MFRQSKVLLVLTNLILLHSGFMLSIMIVSGLGSLNGYLLLYRKIALWLSLIALVLFYFFDLYTGWNRKRYRLMAYSILSSTVLFIVSVGMLTFFSSSFVFLRSFIFLAWILIFLFLFTVHTLIWLVNRKNKVKRKALVIGHNRNDGLNIANMILRNTDQWFDVEAILTSGDKCQFTSMVPLVDDIFVSHFINGHEKYEITKCALNQGKEVIFMSEPADLFILGACMQQIDDIPTLHMKLPAISGWQVFVKRLIDMFFAIILLGITSPILVALYLAIPLTSTGPAVYKQQRIGLRGKPYYLYKFRSMVENAEEKTGPVLASEDDCRVTGLGKFIRSTRLDELPQLLNVIKGDMSLVGPRPEREYFVRRFVEEIPGYEYRMTVKPGITGLAQIMAKYSTKAKYKLYYDLVYIFNYSLLLDLKILFLTIPVLLDREKSAGVKVEN